MQQPYSQPFSPSRRRLLKGAGAAGVGLVIGFHWGLGGPRAMAAETESGGWAPNAFVRIAPDDTVTVISKHIEFGQGSYTGVATVLAEELDADWSRVQVAPAPANAELYGNALLGGMQGTGGSTAMASSWDQLRQAGATARAMLVAAAAERWGVPASELSVAQGVVRHAGSGREARFGELAEAAGRREAPKEVRLKDPSSFRLIGHRVPRVDASEKSKGEAQFTLDIYLPDMLTAVLLRPPLFGATLRSLDDSEARKVRGVVDVVRTPRGVAVLAEGFWAAKKGRDALKAEWDDSAAEKRGTEALYEDFAALAREPGATAEAHGDAQTAIDGGTRVIEAEYRFPYLAHAPMEPLDAVIRATGDGYELWAGSQIPTIDQGVVAKTLGVPAEKVAVHTQFAGGSFGRRATPNGDVAMEVAGILKATDGRRPVKLVWTREDDIQGGRYRPLFVHRLRAALDDDGRPVAWQHRLAGQSIMKEMGGLRDNGVDPVSVEGAEDLPYSFEHFAVEGHNPEAGVPVLWWRSVGHTHTAFSTETFMDELAHAAGEDPVAFRLARLGDHDRHRGVLELAADRAGWGKPVPEGRARGVAVHKSFNSYVAQVVEVSKGENGLPRVHRVVCAVDCGVAINPHNIEAQMQSGIGYGLGAALYDEVVLEDGRPKQANFDTYLPTRMTDMPEVEVHIVDSDAAPTGVGEPGTPPVAPAVANAWFALTGERVRRLPFRRKG
ncbi:xanthine dehydrogenase family protein molybdopterin-binding subunit [Arhodomonas aquaeolei]|uniref:xanthine dehydrogenase family protein molybdopterin-binding subunit n=1 Tax=Arhodomonas aquaeolei TaxID=2369 RepID=UPI00216A61FF|nr:xanthine dehydrogenase family protein molybdopterin-binding subunit [Arhodomonas aquaeolei]MCS4505424.1 xanthine dehydrogenase family protein molybdopterin-binding subunit [Arhodomonas aquaeolei]